MVHFLQALGSQLLHNQACGSWAGRDVLAAIDDAAATQRFAREARFLTVTGERGVSTWDLLEAAAAIEARRLIPQAAWTSPDQAGPASTARRPARRGGRRRAVRLPDVLRDPDRASRRHVRCLAEAAATQDPDLEGRRASAVLDQLDWGEFDAYWDLVSAGEPVGTPYLAEPLREGMRRIGRSRLLELLARPSAHLHELKESELRACSRP